METVSGETPNLMKKSATGSITFVAKGLRVLNVMVLWILPLIISAIENYPKKRAICLAPYDRLDLLIYIVS